RIALLGAAGQGWVHVVGVGGETAASQGALAIAATYAGADLVVLVDLGAQGRHLVRRQGEELRFDPVDDDGPRRGVVVVTTGVLRPTGSRLLAHQGTAMPSAAEMSEPLLVYAVAAGRATEDFIGALAWAPRPASSSRPLFILVS
ncbi:MAG: hypothetical protein HQL38_17165, partial [Alphaproteobacteria bacterium]|nr:hypothetical protein [Alphaproteobacteria bacterium]